MRAAEVNSVVLHYTLDGPAEGPFVVFSNSIGTDFRIWDRVVPLLAPRYRLLRYDSRGHGLSSAPPGPYTIDDHVGDLLGLLNRLDISRAAMVGLSVGGLIAQGAAAARPALFQGLVLCDTAPRIGSLEMWRQRMDAIEAQGLAGIADAIMERWFSKTFRGAHPEELSAWRAMLTRTPQEGYLGTCAALRDTDLSDSTAQLRLPTLWLCGSEDGATPPELVRAGANSLANSQFALIDGAGHLPCIEEPEAVTEEILAFLKDIKYF